MKTKKRKPIEDLIFFHPYKSSWFNKMMGFINIQKVPAWFFISIITFMAFIIAVVINALGSQKNPFQFSPVVYLTFVQIAYTLSLINLLDQRARKALVEFKPVLNSKAEDYSLIEKRLTVLPAKIVNLIMIGTISFFSIWWFLMYRFGDSMSPESEFAQYANEFTKNAVGIYFFVVFGFLWLINFIFIYHTFYQLKAINFIYTKCSRVNIFQKQEIYAFSKVSATNAIGLILLSPLWIIFEGSSASMAINIAFSAIAVVIFLWPLRGVHNIMKKQKESLIKETSLEKEKIIKSILSFSKDDQFGSIKETENTLSALVKTESEIEKISTWPWQLETIRQIIGALLFPIVIWFIQFFLNRLLNS